MEIHFVYTISIEVDFPINNVLEMDVYNDFNVFISSINYFIFNYLENFYYLKIH